MQNTYAQISSTISQTKVAESQPIHVNCSLRTPRKNATLTVPVKNAYEPMYDGRNVAVNRPSAALLCGL